VDELARAGERAEAAGDAEAAAFAQLWLGYLHNRREERERAVEHFERSAALAPPSTDLCAALCQTYARLGRDGPARDWGAKSLALRAAEGDCARPSGSPAPARAPSTRRPGGAMSSPSACSAPTPIIANAR
jgi:Flp pilus assembly protein TadD